MKRLITTILITLLATRVIAQDDCPQGYVERNVKCGGKIVVKCVPENYSCDKCWMLEFAPCPGQKSGGSWFYGSYERAHQAAQKESNNWHDGKCTWYDNTKYKIYIDDEKYCSTTPNAKAALKNDLLNKIKPFLQRYKAEIENYRRYFNGQPYKPGAVFKEYETQLKQAEENVSNLETMLNNINDNNLSQIENMFNNMQQEGNNLKQADTYFKNEINAARQEEINKQQADEAKRQREQQLEQQRKTQEKIDAQMRELNRKSQAQADIASGIVDGIGSIIGTIQTNQAKRSIANDNSRREQHFEELKTQVQNEEGELVECNYCYGEGYKDCNSCGSTGKNECGVCYGKAGETCSICNGTGTYSVGSMTLSCTSCFGKGVKNCSYCGNTGQTLCSSCNGLGKTQCYHCYGTGQEFKRNYSPKQNVKVNTSYQTESQSENKNTTEYNKPISSNNSYAKVNTEDNSERVIEYPEGFFKSKYNSSVWLEYKKKENNMFIFEEYLFEDNTLYLKDNLRNIKIKISLGTSLSYISNDDGLTWSLWWPVIKIRF